jgi:hypothetical protein
MLIKNACTVIARAIARSKPELAKTGLLRYARNDGTSNLLNTILVFNF